MIGQDRRQRVGVSSRPRPATGRPATGRPATGRPATSRPATGRPAAPRAVRIPVRGARAARAPFVLLVLSLLGGGLICLLVINTTLGAASFDIQRLQQSANAKTVQEQQLQEQLATDENIATIQREACALGMRPQQQVEFLNLRTHRLYKSSSGAVTPGWCPR
jgi:hypothetical protein